MALVRHELPGDTARIYAVHAESFPSALEAQLVDRLRAANRLQVSMVAEVDGLVIAHVAFSPVTTDRGVVGSGLAPIAVLKSYQHQGTGAVLVRAGLHACREAGLGWVVVLGEPAYYGRFGFRAAAEFGLSDEYDGGLAFQALELIPGALPKGAGLVRYAPEFSSLASDA
jgi:putative acetyltransferase